MLKNARRGNDDSGADSVTARIVCTRDSGMRYKVILTRNGLDYAEHRFLTIRECEAFVRQSTPAPPVRCTLYDREAGEA
jgi:hypothetical protein